MKKVFRAKADKLVRTKGANRSAQKIRAKKDAEDRSKAMLMYATVTII